MICSKCGTQIPNGKIYCSVCGTEVQLIPDYNFLEDDMLSDIISQGVKGTTAKGETKQDTLENGKEDRKINKQYFFIWAGVFFLVLATVAVLACVRIRIKNNQENSYEYQYSQAVKSKNMDDLENALYYYGRAWDLSPMDKNAPYEMVDIYLALGDENSAIDVVEQLIAVYGYDKESCKKLIDIYEEQGDYEKIWELCEEVKNSNLLDLFKDYLVEQPSFSRSSGTYTNQEKIEITSPEGYDIYYTTNGSDPIESGILYQGELNLKNGTSLVQAVTKSPKGFYSEVVKATYTIRYE